MFRERERDTQFFSYAWTSSEIPWKRQELPLWFMKWKSRNIFSFSCLFFDWFLLEQLMRNVSLCQPRKDTILWGSNWKQHTCHMQVSLLNQEVIIAKIQSVVESKLRNSNEAQTFQEQVFLANFVAELQTRSIWVFDKKISAF